jgi:hypothetical protein
MIQKPLSIDLECINQRFAIPAFEVPCDAVLSFAEWTVIYSLLKKLAYPDFEALETAYGPLYNSGVAYEAESVGTLVRDFTRLPRSVCNG